MTSDRVHIHQHVDPEPYCTGMRIALEHLAQAAEQYLKTDHRSDARDLELRRNLGEAVTDASLVLYPKEAADDQWPPLQETYPGSGIYE